MTKLISIFIIAVVIFCAYQLFQHWEKVKTEGETRKQEESAVMNPAHLPGLPPQLETSYQAVARQGPAALRQWLQTFDSQLADPRKAWIELDLCVALMRVDPSEARRIYQAVKSRTPANSPIQPKLKELEKTFQ